MGDAPLKVTARQLDDGGSEDTTDGKEPATGSFPLPRRLRPVLSSPTTRVRQGARTPAGPGRPPALLVRLTLHVIRAFAAAVS